MQVTTEIEYAIEAAIKEENCFFNDPCDMCDGNCPDIHIHINVKTGPDFGRHYGACSEGCAMQIATNVQQGKIKRYYVNGGWD